MIIEGRLLNHFFEFCSAVNVGSLFTGLKSVSAAEESYTGHMNQRDMSSKSGTLLLSTEGRATRILSKRHAYWHRGTGTTRWRSGKSEPRGLLPVRPVPPRRPRQQGLRDWRRNGHGLPHDPPDAMAEEASWRPQPTPLRGNGKDITRASMSNGDPCLPAGWRTTA